jgi:hypothetical protein
MGDRCAVQIFVRRSDLDKARSLLEETAYFASVDPETHFYPVPLNDYTKYPCAELYEEEVNYAGGLDFDTAGDYRPLIDASIPFIIRHGIGDDYPAGLAAFDGTTYAYAATIDGDLAVTYDIFQDPPTPLSTSARALATLPPVFRSILNLFAGDPS